MNKEQIQELEHDAEQNNGRCSKCQQTIKIYYYKLNKTHASFLKAMAAAVRESGINDVDISTIGIAYSTRSQVTKIRQHGLIARIKDERGVQLPRRWLITHKGWQFLNGQPVPERVIIYNNQVLGHGENGVTISELLGGSFDPEEPIYAETPVSEPEARILSDVRQPRKHIKMQATFKGRDAFGKFRKSQDYELEIDRLQVGNPIKVISVDGQRGLSRAYKDIAAFRKDWLPA